MKYVIIIPDGGADRPLPELDGLTPLQAADTPNLDKLARSGRVGTVATTPEGFGAGSDVCTMDLLGYDPAEYHTGRAPLEAAALGLTPDPTDTVFRLNLVNVTGNPTDPHSEMMDHSAGAISDAEARRLLEGLMAHWRATLPELAATLTLTPGESYRSILVDSSGLDHASLVLTPPHEIPGLPWANHLPVGDQAAADMLTALIESSAHFLPAHEVNKAREDQGLRPANLAWIWGQGTTPRLPSFESRFGVKGAMLTSVDLLRGIAKLIGFDVLDCPGLTSYHDTDYAAQCKATIAALDTYDLVVCHVEAPDEASHQGDFATKIASLESIDARIVGPVIDHLKAHHSDPKGASPAESGEGEADDGWRVLVMPDHYTLCATRKHDATPVPFLMAGAWVRSIVERPFTEAAADEADLHIDPGCELMEYFLKSGLRQ
ncbi:MAG: 2,3-bisphosphoglycerate-independent phosphoglycerate mutase [Phycisphaerales bacterium]|jgi:2,3-bisphosphoglycerate-independent phosphoglycerate mutase